MSIILFFYVIGAAWMAGFIFGQTSDEYVESPFRDFVQIAAWSLLIWWVLAWAMVMDIYDQRKAADAAKEEV